jgi:hypothetical protein
MRETFLIIGTGKTPQGLDHYTRIQSIDKYIGLKGHVSIHLHGEWETLVTPEKLRMALVNLNHNPQTPTVTLSL